MFIYLIEELIWTFGTTWATVILTIAFFLLLYLIFRTVRWFKFHQRAYCSICGMTTGVKGNKRFQLVDGCMCEVCADKLLANEQIVKRAGPNFFAKPPHDFSVAEVRGAVAHYNEVGRDRVLQEHAAIREQRRQQGVVCPKCGGRDISATSSDVASDVRITCLNCGYQWYPGQHRSW